MATYIDLSTVITDNLSLDQWMSDERNVYIGRLGFNQHVLSNPYKDDKIKDIKQQITKYCNDIMLDGAMFGDNKGSICELAGKNIGGFDECDYCYAQALIKTINLLQNSRPLKMSDIYNAICYLVNFKFLYKRNG